MSAARRETAATDDPVVLRQASAVWITALVGAVCTAAMADAWIETDLGYALRVSSVACLVIVVCGTFLATPCLVVERAGLVVVNPLRIHRIAFEDLEDVQVRGLLTVVVRDRAGRVRRVTSWNAPGLSRQFADTSSPAAAVIESRRTAWTAAGAPLGTRSVVVWRWRGLLLIALLAAITVTIWSR